MTVGLPLRRATSTAQFTATVVVPAPPLAPRNTSVVACCGDDDARRDATRCTASSSASRVGGQAKNSLAPARIARRIASGWTSDETKKMPAVGSADRRCSTARDGRGGIVPAVHDDHIGAGARRPALTGDDGQRRAPQHSGELCLEPLVAAKNGTRQPRHDVLELKMRTTTGSWHRHGLRRVLRAVSGRGLRDLRGALGRLLLALLLVARFLLLALALGLLRLADSFCSFACCSASFAAAFAASACSFFCWAARAFSASACCWASHAACSRAVSSALRSASAACAGHGRADARAALRREGRGRLGPRAVLGQWLQIRLGQTRQVRRHASRLIGEDLGVIITTSSVCALLAMRLLNRWPRIGMSPMPGIFCSDDVSWLFIRPAMANV